MVSREHSWWTGRQPVGSPIAACRLDIQASFNWPVGSTELEPNLARIDESGSVTGDRRTDRNANEKVRCGRCADQLDTVIRLDKWQGAIYPTVEICQPD